jgi:DNA (cytosine-5)-methyltransferase 1
MRKPSKDCDTLGVVDLFSGGGGFTVGAQQAGARILLAVEAEPRFASIYKSQHGTDHLVEATLGTPGAEVRDVAGWIAQRRAAHAGPIHLHGSPPCQKLSQANQLSRDRAEGLRLVAWYLDLVATSKPDSWSMEQVNHPAVRELLAARGVAFVVIDAANFDVPPTPPPHHRRRLAGDRGAAAAR